MLKELIGARLIEFDTDHFAVSDGDGNIRTFVFEEYEGECCGFNELENTLFVSKDELARNPVITKIEYSNVSDAVYDDEEHVIITFFGEAKKLAEINSLSSSGSGWGYGACVTLKCMQTDETETITSW